MNVKIVLIILGLFLIFKDQFSYAQEKTIISYEIYGKKVLMKKTQDGNTLNKSCADSQKCMAYKAISKKISKKDIPSKFLNGGKNPGSIVCTEMFNGTVVIAVRDRAEQSFCLFKDKSLVSTNSLWK
jgi:hypothetical protein